MTHCPSLRHARVTIPSTRRMNTPSEPASETFNLTSLVRRHARRQPEQLALVVLTLGADDGEASPTYRGLRTRAEQVIRRFGSGRSVVGSKGSGMSSFRGRKRASTITAPGRCP